MNWPLVKYMIYYSLYMSILYDMKWLIMKNTIVIHCHPLSSFSQKNYATKTIRFCVFQQRCRSRCLIPRSLEVNSAICRKWPPDLSTTKMTFLELGWRVAVYEWTEFVGRFMNKEQDFFGVFCWVFIEEMNKLLQLDLCLKHRVLVNLVTSCYCLISTQTEVG